MWFNIMLLAKPNEELTDSEKSWVENFKTESEKLWKI
jgi:hypothetical protein